MSLAPFCAHAALAFALSLSASLVKDQAPISYLSFLAWVVHGVPFSGP